MGLFLVCCIVHHKTLVKTHDPNSLGNAYHVTHPHWICMIRVYSILDL